MTMTTWAWVLIVAFGVVKLPIACVMLWLPLRKDSAALPPAEPGEEGATGEDEGGSKTLPDPPGRPGPRRPHPRTPLGGPHAPRRGPHGTPASPPRTRHATLAPHRPHVEA